MRPRRPPAGGAFGQVCKSMMWIERTWAVGLAITLVGLAAPVVAQEDDETLHEDDGMVFVRHDYTAADHQGTGHREAFACGHDDAETAFPTMAQYCTTGAHNAAFVYILLGFDLVQSGLTGTLDNVVASDAGEVRLRCNWFDGDWTGCQVLSTDWPSAGQSFCHYVWAYETAVLPVAPDLDDCEPLVEDVPTGPASAGIGAPEGPWRGHLTHS